MVDNSNQDNVELTKIDNDITKHRNYAFILITTVYIIFTIYFLVKVFITKDAEGLGFTPISNLKLLDSGDWGTFGDFIGGILNPIFALFAFYWLTYSVRLQIKELKDTRTELAKASVAQEKSAEHQESIAELEQKNVDTQKEILELQKQSLQSQIDANAAQQQQIAIQNFESLFFELLKAKTEVTENISINIDKSNPQNIIHGKGAIEKHILYFKKKNKKSNWEEYYTENLLSQFGSYFRLSYQVVKLINNNESLKLYKGYKDKSYSVKQKEYFDIFRATFNQYELEAFFFNCAYSYGDRKFKVLLEDYGFFEPLLIDTSKDLIHKLTGLAYQYNAIAFEENDDWQLYFSDIENLKIANKDSIRKSLINLYNSEFIYMHIKPDCLPEQFDNFPLSLSSTLEPILDYIIFSWRFRNKYLLESTSLLEKIDEKKALLQNDYSILLESERDIKRKIKSSSLSMTEINQENIKLKNIMTEKNIINKRLSTLNGINDIEEIVSIVNYQINMYDFNYTFPN